MAHTLLSLETPRTNGTLRAMRATALLYHDIVSKNHFAFSGFQSQAAHFYKIDPATFRRHLQAIAVGSTLVPGAFSANPQLGHERQLLLTFDDGGVSAVHTADILDEHGWVGHFFIPTNYVGTPGFVSERQLLSIHCRGHVVGSHSCSHPLRITRCSSVQLAREWSDSIRRLEDILGNAVTTASIPGGYYGRRVAQAAASAGINALFTSEPLTTITTIDGCLLVGRFCVRQGVSDKSLIDVVADKQLPKLRRLVAWNGKKALKFVGGTALMSALKALIVKRSLTDGGASRPG